MKQLVELFNGLPEDLKVETLTTGVLQYPDQKVRINLNGPAVVKGVLDGDRMFIRIQLEVECPGKVYRGIFTAFQRYTNIPDFWTVGNNGVEEEDMDLDPFDDLGSLFCVGAFEDEKMANALVALVVLGEVHEESCKTFFVDGKFIELPFHAKLLGRRDTF